MSAFDAYEHFYVLNDQIVLSENMCGKTYFITHSERDLKFFLNLWEAYRILRRERPHVILSTGAGPAVPFSIVGRILFDIRIIYIETITSVHRPSLTGRIMYHLAHNFFYQWQYLSRFFPKGTYGGPLL